MKNVMKIRKKLEAIRGKWNEEKSDNERKIAQYTAAINQIDEELKGAPTAEDYTKSAKVQDELRRKLRFYQMQKENFRHELTDEEHKAISKELAAEYNTLVDEAGEEIRKTFEKLMAELAAFDREALEIQKLQNEVNKMGNKKGKAVQPSYIKELSKTEAGYRYLDAFASFLDFVDREKRKRVSFELSGIIKKEDKR